MDWTLGREAAGLAQRVLDRGIAARVFPCAVAEAGTSRGPCWQHAAGRLTYDGDAPRATTATIFDLASLTKVVATTTIAMRLVEAGRLGLRDRVADRIAAWRAPDRRLVRVQDLLEHGSGLPAWAPVYERRAGRRGFTTALAGMPLAYPPRAQSIYSDLGFILLGFIVKDAGRAAIDVQFDRLVPMLALDRGDTLTFRPRRSWRARIAPTRYSTWRDRLLVGEVDDDNAAALDGVAAHAGLFGTCGAVAAFARALLRILNGTAAGDDARLVAPATLRRFLARSRIPGSSRALGWDTMLPTSSCGTRMSASAFGHTGFTGTSLWIDPARDAYAVLLTNRVYPDGGSNEAIQAARRAFHDALFGDAAR